MPAVTASRARRSREYFSKAMVAPSSRTAAAGAVTWKSDKWYGFPQKPFDVDFIPRDDCTAAEAMIGPDVAAVIVEPVQGEGGFYPAPDEFLQELRAIKLMLPAAMQVAMVAATAVAATAAINARRLVASGMAGFAAAVIETIVNADLINRNARLSL